MNERIETEIAIYLNKNVLNRIQNDDTIQDFTTFEAGEIACHFYNLALEDVRKEVERLEKDAIAMYNIHGIFDGYIDLCGDLMSFIDNLTK